MGKLNFKKVMYILFIVAIATGFYGCPMKPKESTEVETVTNIKGSYPSAIINQYGSYKAFEKSILADLNVIRAQYGNVSLTSEWHAEAIAQAVSEINASINNPTHIYAYEYSDVTGMYRKDELCIISIQSELLDPSFVIEQLSNYSTEKIITDPDNIYVGIGLKVYEDKIAIVIDAYSKSDFNNFIIGSQKIVELDSNGTQYLNKSIWAFN